jgi:hypothetical protein
MLTLISEMNIAFRAEKYMSNYSEKIINKSDNIAMSVALMTAYEKNEQDKYYELNTVKFGK